jgi:hypothetical protein
MNAKEKAKELIELYCQILSIRDYEKKEKAKQCALIAIDLILAINKEVWDDFHNEYFLFWVDVKKEIELL